MGAHVGDGMFTGEWSPSESALHINCLQLIAIFRTVEHCLPDLVGKSILLGTANSTVVSYVTKQGGGDT
jgi:hypothetical protein